MPTTEDISNEESSYCLVVLLAIQVLMASYGSTAACTVTGTDAFICITATTGVAKSETRFSATSCYHAERLTILPSRRMSHVP